MTPSFAHDTRFQTRRHFFSQCALGLGGLALASLLSDKKLLADEAPLSARPPGPKPTHFPPRAKAVIYLFMAGGPSQLELFDYKPTLVELNGKAIPDSFLEGRRFAFMDSSFKNRSTLLGSKRKFAQHGQDGAWVSELMPQVAGIVDDIAVVKSCATNLFNHAPANLFMNTASGL